MASKSPRRGKLTQFMSNHVLRDIHGNELVAVVDGNRVADEIRRNGRATRPSFHHALVTRTVQQLDLPLQTVVDVRTFF